MSDPYVPPADDLERRIRAAELPWVRYSRWTLWFCGAAYVLIGLGIALPVGGLLLTMPVPTEDALPLMIMAVLMPIFTLPFAALNLVTASGLGRGAKWSWFAALVLGGIYVSSACLPFGIVLLVGMLQSDVRQLFLEG